MLLIGCSSSKPQLTIPEGSATVREDSATVREDFDPNTLEDDDFLLQPPVQDEVVPPTEAPSEATRQVAGFRVQVAVVSGRAQAEALRDQIQREARALAYIQRDPATQLYQIQAGNCHAPKQAEKLGDAIRALGFHDAYVVRTRIHDKSANSRIAE